MGSMVKKLILPGLVIWLVLEPFSAFAHGTRYLEFNPDSSSSLKVSDVAVPSQVLFPQSDFLGGFDFWLANPGSSGTATFSLLNNGGDTIFTRTVTIGNIAENEIGTRFHIDFNSQVAVLSSQKYSIKVISSMPELKLYYSNRVQVLAHNAPFISEYITGVGKLGEEEQDFSFKYALYETTESSAPIISNVVWTVVSSNQMRVDFNANEPVDYKIEYGQPGQGYSQSTNFTGEYHFCAPGIAICSFNISVSSDTSYQYSLTIKDSWGNQAQSSGTFTSGSGPTPSPILTPTPQITPTPTPTPVSSPTGSAPPSTTAVSSSSPTSASVVPPDKEPPLISNVRIADVKDKSVEIAWTTNEATNSHLLISTPFFVTIKDSSDSTFELEHLVKIDGLGANTNYIATITSNDIVGNTSKASLSFSTLPPILPEPIQQPNQNNQPSAPGQPIQSSQQSEETQNNVSFEGFSGGGGIIRWDLPEEGEPSDGYRVDIFDKNGKLVKTILIPKGSNSAKIDGLENDEYSAIVYANNDGVFEKIDQPAKLKMEPSFIKRLLAFWWALTPLIVGLVYIVWRNFRKILWGYQNVAS